MSDEVTKIIRSDETRARLDTMGTFASGGSPEEFDAFITAETAKWAKVIKDAGVKARLICTSGQAVPLGARGRGKRVWSLGLAGGNAAGAVKTARPVVHAHVFHPDSQRRACGECMNLPVAHIDAHVAERTRMVLKNTRSPGCRSFLSMVWVAAACSLAAPGQHQANGLLVHGFDEAAAVKAGFHRIAATLVGHAHETHGV
jgi:hypothetical protein